MVEIVGYFDVEKVCPSIFQELPFSTYVDGWEGHEYVDLAESFLYAIGIDPLDIPGGVPGENISIAIRLQYGKTYSKIDEVRDWHNDVLAPNGDGYTAYSVVCGEGAPLTQFLVDDKIIEPEINQIAKWPTNTLHKAPSSTDTPRFFMRVIDYGKRYI